MEVFSVGKTRTLTSVLYQAGVKGVLDLIVRKLKMTWRSGEVWELGRFLGRPTGIVRLDGCRFTIDKTSVPANVINLLLSHQYELPERVALKSFLNPSLPLVELGACIGVLSCVSNRVLQNPENHVAVEANPELLPLLQENRDRNLCHFTIVHAALAHGAPSVTLNVSDNVLASSLQVENAREVVVPAISLERLINDFKFQRCTLLCDIEGAEVDLVENEIATIAERVETIIMETHERLVGEDVTLQMIKRLETAGFHIAQRDGDVFVFVNGGGHDGSAENACRSRG